MQTKQATEVADKADNSGTADTDTDTDINRADEAQLADAEEISHGSRRRSR